MGDWRKQQSESVHRRTKGSAKWGPQNRDSKWNWRCGKPPRISNEFQVPRWEVDFCRSAGMEWHKLLKAKKSHYCWDRVLLWNDSAGEQSFQNAKARYWARINGLESDIPMPDSNIYIDIVNQDEIIDPILYKGLSDSEREHLYDDDSDTFVMGEDDESVIIWGDYFFLHHDRSWAKVVIRVGWGDPPEEPHKPNGPVIPTGWDETQHDSNKEEKIIPPGWGDAEVGWDVTKSNNYRHVSGNENHSWHIKGYNSHDNHNAHGNSSGGYTRRWTMNGNKKMIWRKKEKSMTSPSKNKMIWRKKENINDVSISASLSHSPGPRA